MSLSVSESFRPLIFQETLLTPPKIAISPAACHHAPAVTTTPALTPTPVPAEIKTEPHDIDIGILTPGGVHKRFSITSTCSGNSQGKYDYYRIQLFFFSSLCWLLLLFLI